MMMIIIYPNRTSFENIIVLILCFFRSFVLALSIIGIAITFDMKPDQVKKLNGLFSDSLIGGQVLKVKKLDETTATPK